MAEERSRRLQDSLSRDAVNHLTALNVPWAKKVQTGPCFWQREMHNPEYRK